VWHYWQALTNRARGLPMQTAVVANWQFLVFVPLLVFVSLGVERFIEVPVRGWLVSAKKGRVSACHSIGIMKPETPG